VAVPLKILIANGDAAGISDPRHSRGGEYFLDVVARELLTRFGSEAVYTGGLRVYTTLDRRLQTIAEDVIGNSLTRMPQARGRESLQGALVAIEPTTGYVKAIVGGRDFHESAYNRALDAKRQPGSAFKPFIFAMALESGFSPSSELQNLDQPIDTWDGPWLPSGEHELSSVRLRDALVTSSNRAAAHLFQEVGIDRTLDLVSRFGINSPLPAMPSLALGTGEVSLFELTSAYGVFANRGVWKLPTTIRLVVDRYGRELYRAPDTERPVISEATAYLMTSMMADVVDRGTGTTARAARHWRVVWLRHANDHGSRLRQRCRSPRLGTLHDDGNRRRPPRMVRHARVAGQGEALSHQWHARDRPVPFTDHRDPAYDPNAPDALVALTPVVREGGVYEEPRHVGRMPPLCPLLHGAADVALHSPEETEQTPIVPPASPVILGANVSTSPPTPPRPPGNRPPSR